MRVFERGDVSRRASEGSSRAEGELKRESEGDEEVLAAGEKKGWRGS